MLWWLNSPFIGSTHFSTQVVPTLLTAGTEDLLALEATFSGGHSGRQETELVVRGFLPAPEWKYYLDRHLDKEFATFMMRGIRHGFHIGFDLRCSLKPAPYNFHLVRENPVVVDTYIASKVAAGHLVKSRDPVVRRNPIGIIPKLNQPGK